ncbi:MAG TPA: DUF4160 domain-containing protein [Verrucomicrobiae bacterium]|nr:DUF4160 domain-containing protein [Verrucomicrobiae bacterium]
MPTVFTEGGYRFFFYSNEHRPIHVHVRKGGGEAVFELEGEIELRESVGFKVPELRRAQHLARANLDVIIRCWNEHIG